MISERRKVCLSPSSANRASLCPCSVMGVGERSGEDKTPHDKTQEYTNKKSINGSYLHKVADEALQELGNLWDPTSYKYDEKLNEDEKEMIQEWVEYVQGIIETSVQCSMYTSSKHIKYYPTPEVTIDGSYDCMILTSSELHVLDFKTGDVPVDPEYNLQLMFYVLLFLHDYSAINPEYIQNIYFHIVQPKLGEPKVWSCTYQEFQNWKKYEFRSLLDQVTRKDPEKNPGLHCEQCRRKNFVPCPLGEKFLETHKEELDELHNIKKEPTKEPFQFSNQPTKENPETIPNEFRFHFTIK